MREDQRFEPESSEGWAWDKIRTGQVADFSEYGGGIDPLMSDGWDKRRTLSSSFVREILFREPYRSDIPVEGVRIVGARFSEKVDLGYGRVKRRLWLFLCRFERAVDLSGLRADDEISLFGSTFFGSTVAVRGTESVALNLTNASIHGPVDLSCATVEGRLEMAFLQVRQSLNMLSTDQSPAKFKKVDLTGARVDGDIRLDGATVEGPLDMAGLQVGRSLNMAGLQVGQSLNMHGTKQVPAKFKVDLAGARVDGDIRLDGATVEGPLDMGGLQVGRSLNIATIVKGTVNMNGLQVGGSLFMRATDQSPAKFKEVDLGGAKVDGEINLRGATVEGPLDMNGLQVGRSIFMDSTEKSPAHFKEIFLRGAKVDGYVNLDGATVEGPLDMGGLQVGQSLFMRDAKLSKPVDLAFALVKQNLNLAGADLKMLDLTATRIEGELRLGSGKEPPPSWHEDAHLDMRNTHVGTLQDWWGRDSWDKERRDAWPARTAAGKGELQLHGFVYDRLGGFAADTRIEMLARPKDWYIDWLARDSSYSPQPYEQLASVFRRAGEPTRANDILYAGRERARKEAAWVRWLGLSLLNWTIGYGIGWRYFRALWWILALAAAGMILLLISGQPLPCQPDSSLPGCLPAGWPDRFVYSLGQLLPIVELDPAHGDIRLSGWLRYYFSVHRLVGYVLASFLVAGLAGLTQK